MIKAGGSIVPRGAKAGAQAQVATANGVAGRPSRAALGVKMLVVAATATASVAQAGGTLAVNARVVGVEPVYEQIEVAVPREVCRQQDVPVQDYRPARRSATAPILGAVIGGAIGNAVGNGKRNKQVGVAVGALLGGSIGADIGRQRRAERYGNYPVRYRRETVCAVETDYRVEEQLSGYRVSYQYAGQTFETFTDYKPGATIPVRINVTPQV